MMAIYGKEMRKGVKGFAIWTGVITFMLLVCVMVYPEMKDQMADMNDLFANMGSFTQAFGMDSLNFGSLIGFYGVECGNMLGLGGGFFAAYLGITMLAKEEKEHTAEFLLAHPVSRLSVVWQKAFAVLSQIVLMNVIICLFGWGAIAAIGEDVPVKDLLLIHTAYLILQIEIGMICFGLSAFLRRGSMGIGFGAAALLYFLNLLCNISDQAEWLKYLTPYAYASPADIVANGCFDGLLIALGVLYTVIAVTLGIGKYVKKDIAA